jgi:hypothetical protein
MSNVNNPHGLRPLMRNAVGGRPSCETYTKESGYGQAIYIWDPVTELAGVLNGPASGITPGTTLFRGVAMDYSLASVAALMTIMDDVQALYEAQEDNSGASNVVAAKMGYNANLTTTAGDSTRNTSKVQISGTSINTTGTLDVRIERLLSSPDNAYGAYGRLEIRFNKHLATAGVTAT